MGGDADRANCSHGQQRQGQGVVAAVDLEAIRGRGDQSGRFAHIASGVLDGHDVLDLVGQSENGRRLDLPARPWRNVIEHHRQVGGPGDSGKMGDQAGLRRAVVVGGDSEDSGRPGLGAPAG